ncbi:hypothetical protein CYMTET_27077 [Cymbomonas tetramitiformis]|uniref:Uncharacterized protein n=1 Tax=Cymbomonas tetramitiformis TaxID=36881 RepID=A0AAE0FQZ7_9CHLO|nr:hypothetical protein CYMTET_27077 [Cymbomonas tetramitiformis]
MHNGERIWAGVSGAAESPLRQRDAAILSENRSFPHRKMPILKGAPLLYKEKLERMLRNDSEGLAGSPLCKAWETDGVEGFPRVKLVIGLGTGRSGTAALAALLSKQNRINKGVKLISHTETTIGWSRRGGL